MILLCIKIFLARILDVSLGTFRTIITVKGKSLYAALVGCVEAFIWFVIVREALSTPEVSIWVALSYALGFACGTFIGSKLSERFIEGNFGVQVVTSNQDDKVINEIRKAGYAVSVIEAKGQSEANEKYMLFIEINKKHFNDLKHLIKKLDEKAFIVVNETKYVQNGYFK